MQSKRLYRFEEGGMTVISPKKPAEGGYKYAGFRIIADNGKLLTLNGTDTFLVLDVEETDGWYEIDAPTENEELPPEEIESETEEILDENM